MSNPNNLHLRKLSIKNGVAVGKKTTNPNILLDVSGNVNATKFFGDGSNLTNLNMSNLNISSDISTNQNVRATAFYGDGSHLTGISSGGGGSGVSMFKNLVINGDMEINQYGGPLDYTNMGTVTQGANWFGATGSSQAACINSYVCDRFCVFRDSYVAGVGLSQGWDNNNYDGHDITYVATKLPFTDAGILYYAIINRNKYDTSVSNLNMRYAFELRDTYQIYNKTVNLSFYYHTGANFSGSAINYGLIMGAGEGLQRGAVTVTNTLSTTASPSSSWVRVSFTTTLPSITETNIYLGLFFSYTPSGTAGADDSLYITGVQLEKGSSATSFEYMPYTTKLQLCERYYKTFTRWDHVIGMNTTSGSMIFPIPLRTTMRVAPTAMFIQYLGSVMAYGTSASSTAVTLSSSSTTSTAYIYVTCSSLSTNTGPLYLNMGNVGSNVGISAEM